MRIRCLLLAACACPAAWAQEAVRGSVVDPDGLPVSMARVRLLSAAGVAAAETATGADGGFSLSAAAGGWLLSVESAGFAGSRTPLVLPAPASLTIRLSPAALHGEITVTASRGLIERPAAADAMVESRDGEWFRARPAPTIAHALEGSPGILLQQTSPSQASPFLRGLTGYHVLNLVDGVRFNNATFRSGPNQYLAFLEPSQAQRIESALGPASAQYGSDAMGGTIQVITRDAGFAAGRPELHGDWNLFGTSADAAAGTDLHLALGAGRWAWTGGLSGRKHNDLRAGGGDDSRHVFRRYFGIAPGTITDARQQDTGFSQWGADSKLALRLAPGQSLSVWYQRSSQDGVRNYKDLWGGLGRLQSTLEPQTLQFGYVRYERLGLGFLDSLSATFSANAQGDGSVRQGLRATDSITKDDTQVNAFGYSVQGTAHSGRRYAVVFGGEWYDEHIASTRLVRNPVSGTTAGARPLYPDGSTYRTGALFAQNRFELGRRWRATLGGRWTHVGYRTSRDAFGTAASAQDFGDWTFSAALAWQATSSFSLHALAGRGFRAPNANDLGAIGLNDLGYEIPAAEAAPAGALLGSSAAESALSLGRPVAALQAERLFNYELGARWQGRKWEARAQAFDSELYDPIVRRTLLFPIGGVPDSLAGLPVTAIAPTADQRAQGVVTVATALDPRAVKAFVNDGRARYWGVESSLRFQPAARWTVESAYSYILGRDLNPNRNIRRLPPQQGNVVLRYVARRFWAQTSLSMAGAQRRLSGGDLDDERIGASRSRADIASIFQAARLAPYISQGVFVPSGETLRQVQDRVLPGVADSVRVPLYNSTAGWAVWSASAGIPLGERTSINAGALNLLDRNYRVHGSGMDAPGFNAYLGLRVRF